MQVLLDHEETIHVEGEPWSWETLSEEEAVFSTDMTPLVLAAHTNNYEIIKILLDRGATLPCPHHHRLAHLPLALLTGGDPGAGVRTVQSLEERTVSGTPDVVLTPTGPSPPPPSSPSPARTPSSLPSSFHGN